MLGEFSFHHIGIATNSILETSKYFLEAGYSIGDVIFDPTQNVKVCFMSKFDTPLIELVEPVDTNSPIKNILQKNGVSPYHICYELDNINDGILKLKLKKFVPLSKPVPARALNDRLICFLYNRDVGLIELLQKEK